MSVFVKKSARPTREMVSSTLGRSYKYWQAIRTTLEEQHGRLTEEWKYYGANSGWTLKLLLGKRNLLFFAPHEKYFRVAFIFGDKAVADVQASDLPVKLVQELSNARRYAEGRGLRLDVRKQSDVKNLIRLVEIKVRS